MATITYATKQLRVAANHQEELLPKFQEICSSIESEVRVIPREDSVKKSDKTKTGFFGENKKEALQIGEGAVLFLTGVVLEHLAVHPAVPAVIFLIAYILLGREILWTAAKNLVKGRVFDENFLMSVATLAAFAIGDFAEAVGVMLFYRVGEFFEDVAVARSRSQIMDAVDMRPEVVNLVVGDDVKVVPAEEIKTGDVVLVRPWGIGFRWMEECWKEKAGWTHHL